MEKKGVTVAGFANGSSSTSLAGLQYPTDMFFDDVGDMYIVDSNNNRILYWSQNSVKGVHVIGSNVSGSGANQLKIPSNLMGNDKYYIFDRNVLSGRETHLDFYKIEHISQNLRPK